MVTALGALGCSSLLGLGDFKDAPDGGTAGTGAGGSDAGGGPDAGGRLHCASVSSVLNFIKPSDIADDGGVVTLDTEHIFLAIDEANSAVFVVVPYTATDDTPGVAISSLRDQSNPTPQGVVSARIDSSPSGLLRIMAGTVDATNSTVHLYGLSNETPDALSFHYDGSDRASSIGQLTPLPDPKCANNAQIAFDPTSSRFALGCPSSSGATLHVSDGTNLTSVTTQSTDPTTLLPKAYTYEGGTHLILSEKGFVRFGSNLSGLTEGPLDLSKASTDQTLVLTALPAPAGTTGTTLLAARVSATLGYGTLFAGVFPTSAYADIATKMPSELSPVTTIDLTNSIDFGIPFFNSARITLAGVATTSNRVSYWQLDRSGKPLVIDYTVPNVSSAPLLKAFAAPLGFNTLVVWAQNDGDGGPSSIRVRGEVIACSPN